MGVHILVIDDEKIWLQNLEFTLKRKGYSVTNADRGKKGLELITSDPHKFDIVLLDLMMPDMDGLQVLLALQPIFQVRKFPVILQTGTQEDKYIMEAFSLGALCCLRKPYSHQVLCPIIEQIISGKTLEAQIIHPQQLVF